MSKMARVVSPIVIVIGGVALFFLLSSMRAAPERVERVDLGPLVQSIHAEASPLQVSVRAQGTVRPDREIDLVPQVSGVIEWISPELEAGGFFATADALMRIEAEDYELALEQARAEVERSQFQLQIEQGEAEVARLEWERLRPDQVADPLALRLPQVQASEAGLRAAQARLREAELRLERTTLRAPFHGRVRAVNVDAGQFVGAGQPIGRIYSIEKAQIVVPVPDEELAWIDVPKMDRQVSSDPVSTDPSPGVASVASEVPTPEPPVTIRARYAGRDHRWEGRILRSEGELDPRSRMVRLVIEVSDPYRWVTPSVPQQGTAEFSPLMVGLFCDVEIRGRTLQNVVSLPRSAIHDGNQVWVATRPGTLRVQSVDVVRTDRERGLVRMVLNEGDRIITSQLRGITDGMRIRVTDDGGRP